MTKVNFIIGGVGKAGTTSLHYYLSQHPNIYMSEKKETWFFILEHEKDAEYYESRYFSNHHGEKAIGEATPGYLDVICARQRIWNYNPHMKFIFILRNPIDRAFSHWKMYKRRGYETLSFYDAIKKGIGYLPNSLDSDFTEKRLKHFFKNRQNIPRERYVGCGLYAQHLKGFYALFNRSKIKIFLFEDLIRDPKKLISECFDFLDVQNYTDKIDMEKKNDGKASIVNFISPIIGKCNAHRLASSFSDKQKKYFRFLFDKLFFHKKLLITPSEIDLLRPFYEKENEELSQLIGRDLSQWNVIIKRK